MFLLYNEYDFFLLLFGEKRAVLKTIPFAVLPGAITRFLYSASKHQGSYLL